MLYQVSEKSWYVLVSYYVGMDCSCTPCALYIQMLTAWPDTTFQLQSITLHIGAHKVSHGDFWDTLYKGFMLLWNIITVHRFMGFCEDTQHSCLICAVSKGVLTRVHSYGHISVIYMYSSFTHTHTHTHRHTLTHTHTHRHTYTHSHTQTHTYTLTNTNRNTHTHTHTHTDTETHTQTHTDTDTHTHTDTQRHW
jgi:hypothetical protein